MFAFEREEKTHLRFRRHAANLDVAESKSKQSVNSLAVFVEASGHADRVRELLAPELRSKASVPVPPELEGVPRRKLAAS